MTTEATLERYAEQAQREGTTVAALHKAADERTMLKHAVTATDIGYVVALMCSLVRRWTTRPSR